MSAILPIAVVAYLLLTLAVGAWAARRVKNQQDFLSTGRKLPIWINTFALFALWFGSETVMGASSTFLAHGIGGVIEDPFGAIICLLLFAVFFLKPLYRLNINTLGDLFRLQYGAAFERITSLFMIISFFGYIAAQMVALGILLTLIFSISLNYGIIAGALLVTMYTIAGGMWAISITDFIQSLLIIAGLLAILFYLFIHARLIDLNLTEFPPNTFQFFPESNVTDWISWISAWMVLGLGSIPSQDLFQRANAAKSEKTAMWSTYLGAVLYAVFAMVPLAIAFFARQMYPEEWQNTDPQYALPLMALRHTPIIVQVLFFGALLSAIMSTCSGAMLAPAALLSENIIKPLFKRSMNHVEMLYMSRMAVFVMSVGSLSLALMKGNVFELVADSSILGLVSMFVPLCAALFMPKIKRDTLIVSIFSGTVTWIIFEYLIETEWPAHFLAFVTAWIPLLFNRWLPDDSTKATK